MKRNTGFGLGLMLSFGLLAIPAGAQNQAPSSSPNASAQGSSLGDYARHVRKDGQPKAKPKVFDNDNLPTEDHLSVVGTPRPASVDQTTEAKSGEGSAPAKSSEAAGQPQSNGEKPASSATQSKPIDDEDAKRQAQWKEWQQKLASQKQQVDLMQRELDVAQREYQLRAAAFYADAGNRLRNSGSWDKQDADYKQQIADKQKALDDAKQKLEDMSEEARKAGLPASMREE